ncbi:MAG: hypothetical protein QOK05_2384 [Chloroflexota bacterium]|jgi:hypothetical protein|nr:hypothetical protein [Chloroflexota bacterium]
MGFSSLSTGGGARHARRALAAGVSIAAALSVMSSSGSAFDPSVPLADNPVRSVEPVVITGNQFPTWSAGPEFTFHEPMSPTNSITAGQQGNAPGPLQSNCYDPSANYGTPAGSDPASGDHNCYQSSRLPLRTLPITKGVDPRRILGYRWDGTRFAQIPFQVDQVFTRYLTNDASGFAFYSGIDKHDDLAYDREGFRFLANAPAADPKHPTPAVCKALPYKAPGGGFYDGQPTTPSPNGFHLVDKDEVVFMARDAGNAAPSGAVLPAGILDTYTITVTDPDTGKQGYVYVALGGDNGPKLKYTAANSPYVHYQRDADAGMFVYSQSSYGGYGAAPEGWYCNPDGTLAMNKDTNTASPTYGQMVPAIGQRRPKDTAWITTPRYAFRYDGRWLMTEIHISPTDNGYIDKKGVLHNYGPNVVDRWKARAFQQSPGGTTPCCGYEEEATNWGGSSQLFGEKAGPVRVVRATWGADSSTNNVRREVFYAEQVRYQDALRVHVIPPLDGIYVQRDMAAGIMDTYYNPYNKAGVPVLGINEEVFGNVHSGFGAGGLCYSSQDKLGSTLRAITGTPSIVVPVGTSDPCNQDYSVAPKVDDVHGDFDFFDPTFSGPPGELAWEQTSGKYGTLVERWTGQTYSPGGVLIGAATSFPYYRDDSCFDDGTGTDPGPKLHLRSQDEPKFWWIDPATKVPTSSSTLPDPKLHVKLNPRRCWNHHANGTPYNIPGTQSYDPTKKAEKSEGVPNPKFSPQGDIRYFQGDIGTHGLHVMLIADSDNAQMTQPIDELDSEQIQVILPPINAARQPNVGESYGRSFEKPLVTTAQPAVGLMVENLAVPVPPAAH